MLATMAWLARCRSGLALALAGAIWLAFFSRFGLQAFGFREEGLLLTLAERITRGDVPYRDFSYIRPPLPLAIQAGLLAWTPGYAIPEGRWYFAGQVAVVLAVVYALLGRLGLSRRDRAGAALLAVVCAFTGGFPPMPWHTVDGIFFAALAAWALVAAWERASLALAAAAGLAAGAAALSKQGFVVVGLAGLCLLLAAAGRRPTARSAALVASYLAGGAAIGLTTLAYLAAHGALGAALEAVLVAPGQITREVLHRSAADLVLRMHLPSPTGAALGVAALALVLPRVPGRARLALGGVLLAAVVAGWWAWRSPQLLHGLFLVEPLYTATWIGGGGLLAAVVAGRAQPPGSAVWAVTLGLCILYATTWSYLGIGMARIGLGVGLPLVLLTVSGLEPAGAGGPRGARFAAGALLLYGGLLSASIYVAVPHLDGSRGQLTVPFRTERLRGIRSSALRVRGVDGVVERIRVETARDDYVLAFMDFPALYFLAERRNPTRVDWYLPQELTTAEVTRAVADLAARPPRLVVLNALEPVGLSHPRLRPVLDYLGRHYEAAEQIGEFRLLRPRR
jgi:hypothetical protein